MRTLTKEGGLTADHTGGSVREHLLVPFVRRETDGHFGHDTSDDGPKTFVETQRRFSLYDFSAGYEESASFRLFRELGRFA